MTATLHDLAQKFHSDKLHWHSYIPAYESLFTGGHWWMQPPGTDGPGAGPALRSLRYCAWCRYRNDSDVPIPECPNKGVDVRRILEIGIGYKDLMQPFLPAGVEYIHGSSLKMWEEYFPHAEVFGCDIREDALINEGRIRTTTCDQGSPTQLNELIVWSGGAFDVIIDDGSHENVQQINTASLLLPFVNPGGLYIIEDVWADAGATMAGNFGGMLWKGMLGRDDNMVVIRR